MSILRHPKNRWLHKTVKGWSFLIFLFITLVSLLLLGACRKSTSAPTGILSKEDMVKILSDVLVTEEKINRLSLPVDSSKAVFRGLEVKMFEKAGVSDTVFRKSFDYYMDRPREMEEIYTALVDTLQLREQRVQ